MFCILLVTLVWHCSVSYGSVEPIISNEKLVAERVAGGLENPTTFAFVDANDILVLEKNKGTVLRIHDGEVLSEPLLDVNVANQVERGMLGIAVSENLPENKTYVFLYYTEAEDKTAEEGVEGEEDEDINGDGEQGSSGDGGEPAGNRLYRYELSEDGTSF